MSERHFLECLEYIQYINQVNPIAKTYSSKISMTGLVGNMFIPCSHNSSVPVSVWRPLPHGD